MTAQAIFAADLNRMNMALEAAGAVIDHGDGTFGLDEARVPQSLLETYWRLLQYGFATGLL